MRLPYDRFSTGISAAMTVVSIVSPAITHAATPGEYAAPFALVDVKDRDARGDANAPVPVPNAPAKCRIVGIRRERIPERIRPEFAQQRDAMHHEVQSDEIDVDKISTREVYIGLPRTMRDRRPHETPSLRRLRFVDRKAPPARRSSDSSGAYASSM